MMVEGKLLANWINEASLINKSALCKVAGMDRANLDKFLTKGEIPEQHIEGLKKALEKYNYPPKKEVKILDANKQTLAVKNLSEKPPETNYSINTEEIMPEGLNWKGQLAWRQQNKK